MRARMTIVGMENHLNHKEKSIIDSWTLEDIESFNNETLLASIIFKGGTFEPLYTDPDFFYYMCAFFWKKWERTFTKWFEAFEIKYNPLENYDRHEEWSESHEDSGTVDTTDTRSVATTETTDNDSTEARTESRTTDNDTTTENSVSAFDSSSYSDKDKTVSENDISESVAENITGTNDTTFTSATNDNNTIGTESSNEGSIEHEGHLHGNIGVTTSQEMLKSELEIQSWNIYEHIADIFIREMCVAVY